MNATAFSGQAFHPVRETFPDMAAVIPASVCEVGFTDETAAAERVEAVEEFRGERAATRLPTKSKEDGDGRVFDRPTIYAALDSKGAASQSPNAGMVRGMAMADEMSADEKAEMALRLWEALVMKLIRAGVISTDVTDSIISREFGDNMERDDIMSRLEAMTRRFHGLPDATPADDQPPEP